MNKIKISDKNDGVLSFDLKEVLSAIYPYGGNCKWYLYFLETEHILENFDIVNPLIEDINEENSKTLITWENLILISNSIKQTIDMDLEGVSNSSYIFIRAVDSSYWEIETLDDKLIETLKNTFIDTEISLL